MGVAAGEAVALSLGVEVDAEFSDAADEAFDKVPQFAIASIVGACNEKEACNDESRGAKTGVKVRWKSVAEVEDFPVAVDAEDVVELGEYNCECCDKGNGRGKASAGSTGWPARFGFVVGNEGCSYALLTCC